MQRIIKKSLLLFGVGVLLLCLCSCQNKEDDPQGTSEPHAAVQDVSAATVPRETVPAFADAETKKPTASAEATSATLFTVPEKKGDMVFTEDANDPFIQAIVQKYKVDPARLAGIYAVPAGDNNYFWEFNGTTDADGKLVRNEKTLKYVYTVTADKTEICRTGGFTGNDGLGMAQGYLVFETNKQMILPEFETQLGG